MEWRAVIELERIRARDPRDRQVTLTGQGIQSGTWKYDAALYAAPNLFSNNEKHRPYVQNSVGKLGDRGIVKRFRAYYDEWFDNDDDRDAPARSTDQSRKPSSGSAMTVRKDLRCDAGLRYLGIRCTIHSDD